jgi:nitrite reductase/ring-hydroxylating ferredoxin subunit
VRPRRLSSFIEALLHDRKPRPFKTDPEDVQAIRAAVELRAAEPAAAEPTDAFVRGLQDRLRDRLGAPSALPAEGAEVERTVEKPGSGARTLSRRRLLEGAGIAASAAVIGGIADHLIEGRPVQEGSQQPMAPDGGQWVTVASTDRVDANPITPFLKDDVPGFVVNQDGTLRALSGVCTHQGCVLRANQGSARLDCPCHRAAFSLDGTVLFHEFADPLKPLPTLMVRRDGSDVQVLLPPPETI